jgi:hypothetical protein
MTVQIDEDGPLVEDWRSAKYEATVNGTPVYVWGYAEESDQSGVTAWDLGDSPEQSWVLVNTDETVTVVISLADSSPITSVTFTPPDSGATAEIASGICTMTVPANTRLRVVFNGDAAEALHVFTAPPLTTPASITDYTSLAVTIDSIVTDDYATFTVDDGHGFTDDQRVLIKSTGTRPSTGAGVLPEHDPLYVTVISSTEFQLGTTITGPDIAFASNGSGTITATPASFSSASTTLYWGPGVHVIGKLFKLSTPGYIDAGAVIIGNIDWKGVELSAMRGRGVHAGTFANYIDDNLAALGSTTLLANYPMYAGYEAPDFAAENAISGIVIVAAPFYVNYFGVWSFRNVHVISCWHGQSDGVSPYPKKTGDLTSEVVDCYLYCGDDAVKLTGFDTETCSGTFAICTANSPFMFGYFPSAPDGYARSLTNCHAMHLGSADTGGDVTYPYSGMNAIIKAWVDGWESQTALGVYDVTISGFRVWGAMPSMLLSIGNRAYPFTASGSARDQAGQIQDWTISDLVTQFEPGQVSQIIGRDADNAPRNLTFTGVRFGTIDINEGNYDTYFEVSPFATNIVWDAVPVEEVVLTDAETLWAYVKSVYDSDGLVSLTNIRDRSATSISDLVGEAASASVINLWPSYAQSSFDVTDAVHLETAVEGVIAMLWRRGGSSTTIEQVKWDTVFGEGGTIEKLRRTSSRGRRGPSSNSRTITSTTTVRLYGWSDPASLPPGYLPRGSGMGTDS